jgi:hypothetical protein
VKITILGRRAAVEATVLSGNGRFGANVQVRHNIGGSERIGVLPLAPGPSWVPSSLSVVYEQTSLYDLRSGQYPVRVDLLIAPKPAWANIGQRLFPDRVRVDLQCARRF